MAKPGEQDDALSAAPTSLDCTGAVFETLAVGNRAEADSTIGLTVTGFASFNTACDLILHGARKRDVFFCRSDENGCVGCAGTNHLKDGGTHLAMDRSDCRDGDTLVSWDNSAARRLDAAGATTDENNSLLLLI